MGPAYAKAEHGLSGWRISKNIFEVKPERVVCSDGFKVFGSIILFLR